MWRLFDVYDSCTVRRMCREMKKRQLDSSLTILYALQLRHSTLFQLACSVCFMLCYFFLFTKRWLSVGFASLSMETCSFFLSLSASLVLLLLFLYSLPFATTIRSIVAVRSITSTEGGRQKGTRDGRRSWDEILRRTLSGLLRSSPCSISQIV